MADAALAEPAPRVGGATRLRATVAFASPILLILTLLAAWEIAATVGYADQRVVSRPSAIASLAADWIVTGFIWPHLCATFTEVATGYVLGTVLGLAVAFLFFFQPRIEALLEPAIIVLNAAPRPVLAPLFVLLFGIGLLSKVMLVLLVVFVVTLINLSAGLKEVDPTVVNGARIMGANRRDLMRHVYIPAALVWIAGAMRISVGQAFTTAIVCELLGATRGLGWIVAAGQASIKADWIMAGLLFASLVVIMLDLLLLGPVERRGSHWRVF